MKNHLQNETSPYLLQHQDNPVNWYAWCDEALNLAKKENKPILLSIGYSSCHWCHVMAHESFEDPYIAEIMNRYFINIKVDREERPDLDKIYQTAHALISKQGGGWPLTVFLAPDTLIPFFSGTYFPKENKYGLIAFPELLIRLQQFYQENSDKIKTHAAQLKNALHALSHPTEKTEQINRAPLEHTISQLMTEFDSVNGGFGQAPKFPQPDLLKYLLQAKDKQAQQAALFTLNKIAHSGLYDQLGGGFFRYCVDERWEIPHFEKMLYDNAQLLSLYAKAFQITNNPFYAGIAHETINWLTREMHTENGFFTALDADTEGEEGKFYIWEKQEIQNCLSQEEYKVAELYFDLHHPNFENHFYHLQIKENFYSLKEKTFHTEQALEKILQTIHQKLFLYRKQRQAPFCDNKILTSLNSLTISGLVECAITLNNPAYLKLANNTLDFIYSHLWKNKKLLSHYTQNKAGGNAYLDDYAFLLQALLKYLQAKWDENYYLFALNLAENLLTQFHDEENGGFYFTSHQHEKLIQRPKYFSNDSLPNSNAVTVKALLQLHALTYDTKYYHAAEKTLQLAFPALIKFPTAHISFLFTLQEYLQPSTIIVLRGTAESIAKYQSLCSKHGLCFALENGLPTTCPVFQDKKSLGEFTAYICRQQTCLPPITDPQILLEKLAEIKN